MLRGCQATAILSHWWWEITLENYLAVSYKVKHIPILISSNSSLRYLPKRHEGMCSHKDLYMAALFMIAKISNNLNMHQQENEQNAIYSVIPFRNKKEWTTDAYVDKS